MLVINIIDEDTVNYKKLSMFIGLPKCNGKCWEDLGCLPSICINNDLMNADKIEISINDIIKRYDNNILSEAIVFGGLEPFDSWDDLLDFIKTFRKQHNDDIVIYTGYNEDEISDKIKILSNFSRIIVKFGRFIPNSNHKYDEILGVELASDNQYAKLISIARTKIILNPDKNVVNDIRARLSDNNGYCPCRIDKTPDTKCMCKEFREQTEGECHCGLYIKEITNNER